MIGAWCFIDHFGPTEQTDGMVVAAHPHTGLQTVTWLLEGRVEHRDSLGTIQHINPGQLNLMTAGRGIAHSELSETGPESLHAVQMWLALPKEQLNIEPFFEHQDALPETQLGDLTAKVFVGEFGGVAASTKVFSQLVAAELGLKGEKSAKIPLNSGFEHGILLIHGEITVNGEQITQNQLFFAPAGPAALEITAKSDARMIFLGGEPFGEQIVMWWNFIGRSHDEIVQARSEWNAGASARFSEFEDRIGGRIPAPELPNVQLRSR